MSEFNFTLKEMFEKSLSRYGEKVAIKFENVEVTYDELNCQSNQLAHALLNSGITAGDPVSLLMSNCIEFVVSDLAIIKIGAAKVPLNDMLGEQEILYMLKNSQAKAIIVGPNFYPLIEKLQYELPNLKVLVGLTEPVPEQFISWFNFIEGSPKTDSEVEVTPLHRASLSYTGGTTGLPKGIVQSQKNLVMNLYSHLIELEIVEDDNILLMSPLPHAAGRLVQTGVLKGATTIITKKFDPVEALRLIEKERVTVTFMVPTMIYRILDVMESEDFDLSSIKTIAYAASPILEERLKQGLEKIGPVFFQFYGQSECPNFITSLKKSDHAVSGEKARRLRSCGRPAFMAEVKIVNEKGQEVERNTEGEIVVKSPYVMERYHNLPEKTAETIVDGWLHTGDIGKMDEDGYVYLLDRKNDMIITGGMNVYSSEVENVIQQHPGVRQVAVIGIPHHDWGEQVLALVISESDNEMFKEELMQYCRENLASYKRPKEIKFVTEFPLTNYGKLDKKGMRKPYWLRSERGIH